MEFNEMKEIAILSDAADDRQFLNESMLYVQRARIPAKSGFCADSKNRVKRHCRKL